jgi:thiol-disulfide isomerase/thioredoxin
MTSRGLAVVTGIALALGIATYLYLDRAQAPVAAAATGNDAPLKLAATLPRISLADREGRMRSFDDWNGRSLIVNFWATWCAPCRREIPLLTTLQREHEAEGFQVIGIAVDYRDKVLPYAEQMKIVYPLLIGEVEAMEAASAFGIEVIGLPFTVFSDRQGRIIAAHLGELTAPQADVILAAVRTVNAGQATPEQARTTIEQGLARLPSKTSG